MVRAQEPLVCQLDGKGDKEAFYHRNTDEDKFHTRAHVTADILFLLLAEQTMIMIRYSKIHSSDPAELFSLQRPQTRHVAEQTGIILCLNVAFPKC